LRTRAITEKHHLIDFIYVTNVSERQKWSTNDDSNIPGAPFFFKCCFYSYFRFIGDEFVNRIYNVLNIIRHRPPSGARASFIVTFLVSEGPAARRTLSRIRYGRAALAIAPRADVENAGSALRVA